MKLAALPLAALALTASLSSGFAQTVPTIEAPNPPGPVAAGPVTGLPPAAPVGIVGATNFAFLVPIIAGPLAFGALAASNNSTTSTTSTTN